MLLIRNNKDAKTTLTASTHLEFVKKCETYINKLKEQGKLISAQPLAREGAVIVRHGSFWIAKPLKPEQDTQVGYYHILANGLDDAIAIAKENPEFEYSPTAKIEVRPIKTKETETGFVYPNGDK